MSRQLVYLILLCSVSLRANSDADDPDLKLDYKPALRKKPAVIKETTEIEYRFDITVSTKGKVDNELRNKIIKHSYQHIECSDTGETRNVFDKALPIGWLYSSFGDKTTAWQKYFDTSASEHWVLPNVYCNNQRVLTAIAWMRSGNKGAARKNQAMASGFRDNIPPFYSNDAVNNKNANGVYCKWSGWLFDKNKSYKKYFDTLDNSELFTMVNIYCDSNRVTFMRHGYAGDNTYYHKDASEKPFENAPTPSAAADGSVGCSWQGWLLKNGTDGTWEDRDTNTRWIYEKYFALDKRATTKGDKRKIHGRVINPFCSNKTDDDNGKVTRIRAYCFYPTVWKKMKTCASL